MRRTFGKRELDLRQALLSELGAVAEALTTLDDEEADHDARVHLKRVRALARIGGASEASMASELNDMARTLMGRLSATRDLSAIAECARATLQTASPAAKQGFETLIVHLSQELEASACVPFADTRGLIHDLFVAARAWPPSTRGRLREGIERIIRRARRAATTARGSDEAEARHTWRKREKDRLYSTMLFPSAWPAGRPRRKRRSQRLCDLLGQEHDTTLLINRIEQRPDLAGNAGGPVIEALLARKRQLAIAADNLGARLHRGRA